MILIVAYDIADDRPRVKLHALLLGYGVPLQESLFLCHGLAERQVKRLKRTARQLAKGATDAVHLFPLCANCGANIEDRDGAASYEPGYYFV